MTARLALFLVGAFLFMMAPFFPMLKEILGCSDGKPSEIPRDQAVDPRRSIEQILWCHVYQLGLGSVEQLQELLRGTSSRPHASGTFLLRSGDPVPTEVREGQLIGYGPVRVPAKRRGGPKILSLTDATTEEGGQLVEIHALGSLTLGRKTRILWWASGERVAVGEDAILTGKVSGSREIRLSNGSLFHLLEAPRIRFGEPGRGRGSERGFPVRVPLQEAIPGTVSWEKGSRRVLCRGEVEIPECVELNRDVIVQGRLVVGEGAVIRGSVKTSGGIILEPGCAVTGSLISRGAIILGPHCRVGGPIVAEDALFLGEGASIGSPERRTTAIGKRVTIGGSCQAHGLVRAWTLGEVRIG